MKTKNISFLVNSILIMLLQGCGEDNLTISQEHIDDNYQLIAKQTRNKTSAKLMHVDELSLTGKGVKIGVIEWDGIVNKNHIEFRMDNNKSKITVETNDSIYYHATHVAGTICATGKYPNAKGMAPDSHIFSYCIQSKKLEKYRYGKAALYAYYYQGILLTNNSYGRLNKVGVHTYDKYAQIEDNLIYEINNSILMFKSSGNGRKKEYDYNTTKGPANAKNIFTIGNIQDNKKINSTSDVGPAPGGRIKPDLVANGTLLWSPCSENGDNKFNDRIKYYPEGHENEDNYYYAKLSGTSMATPSATGVAALLIEQYKKTNGEQEDIRADELKAILVNTAEDLGNSGPDYVYGFGLINAKASAEVIKTMSSTQTSKVRKGTLSNFETDRYKLQIDNDNTKFKATISWIDKPGKNLVNDLDIILFNKNGKEYKSYTLNPKSPEQNATKNGNHIDNTEQIEAILPKGDYTIVVHANRIVTQEVQKYTLVSNKVVYLKSDYYETDRNGFFDLNKYPEALSKLKQLISDFKNKKIAIPVNKWTNVSIQDMEDIVKYLDVDSNQVSYKGRVSNGYTYFYIKNKSDRIYFFYFDSMSEETQNAFKEFGLGSNTLFMLAVKNGKVKQYRGKILPKIKFND